MFAASACQARIEVNTSTELSIWHVCLSSVLVESKGELKQADQRSAQHSRASLMSLSHFQCVHVVFSLFLLLHSFLCSAPGLRFGWGTWMDGSLLSDPRTQLPGETTMTPPPHTRQARQGPPAEDMPHRVETTAANKVSIHMDIYTVCR